MSVKKITGTGNFRIFICYCVISISTVLAYWNVMDAGFVYDDYLYIVQNPLVQNPERVLELLSSEYARGMPETAHYRPVVSFTYFLNVITGGMNPQGFHKFNIALHIITCFMVYAVTRRIFPSSTAAFFAATGFALHPLRTESVAWIVGRAEILATLFGLISFHFYLKNERACFSFYRAVSLFCFLISIFAKENTVMLPFLIILYDLIALKQKLKHVLKRITGHYLPYLGVIVIWILARWALIGYIVPSGDYRSVAQLGTVERVTTIARVTGYYLFVQLFPFYQCADYEFRIIPDLISGQFIVSMGLIIAFLAAVCRIMRARPRTAYFGFWFFIAIIPVSNIVPIGEIMAERFLYFPGMGLHILAAVIIARMIHGTKKTWYKVIIFALVLSVFAGYFHLTRARNRVWHNEKSFWMDAMKKAPGKTRPHVGMGSVYLRENRLDRAEKHFKMAMELNTNRMGVARAWLNLGVIRQNQKRWVDALQCFEESLQRAPGLFRAYNNLGNVYLALERPDDAIEQFEKALNLENLDPGILNNLGNAYQQKKQYEKAVEYYRKALSLDPDNDGTIMNNVFALNNWANELFFTNEIDKAIGLYGKAMSLNPDFEGSYINLASAYMQIEQPEKAVYVLLDFLDMNPCNVETIEFLFQVFVLKLPDREMAMEMYARLQDSHLASSKLDTYREILEENFPE